MTYFLYFLMFCVVFLLVPVLCMILCGTYVLFMKLLIFLKENKIDRNSC